MALSARLQTVAEAKLNMPAGSGGMRHTTRTGQNTPPPSALPGAHPLWPGLARSQHSASRCYSPLGRDAQPTPGCAEALCEAAATGTPQPLRFRGSSASLEPGFLDSRQGPYFAACALRFLGLRPSFAANLRTAVNGSSGWAL